MVSNKSNKTEMRNRVVWIKERMKLNWQSGARVPIWTGRGQNYLRGEPTVRAGSVNTTTTSEVECSDRVR